jgi:hypothetical protein
VDEATTLANIRTVVAWSVWDTERDLGRDLVYTRKENHYEPIFLLELEREQVLSQYNETFARNIETKLNQLARVEARLALLLEHSDTNRVAWVNRLRMIDNVDPSKIGEWAER